MPININAARATLSTITEEASTPFKLVRPSSRRDTLTSIRNLGDSAASPDDENSNATDIEAMESLEELSSEMCSLSKEQSSDRSCDQTSI